MKLNYKPHTEQQVDTTPAIKASTKLGMQQKLTNQLAVQLGQQGGAPNMPNIGTMEQ